MKEIKRDELIFWRDVPVDVERGAFEYLTEKWGNSVIFICHSDYSNERKQCEWDAGGLQQIILENQSDPESTIKEIFREHPNAVHFFNGFRGKFKDVLKRYAKDNSKKLCILAERPNYYSTNKFNNSLVNNLYRYYSFIYSRKIDLFLTMGQKGKITYSQLGFNNDRLFPFMYNPSIRRDDKVDSNFDPQEIKLLYIGRLNSGFKGVDILMNSLKMINAQNWKLDFVGGYGDLKDEILNLAKNNQKINYKGTWKSEDVVSKIKEYDLCIVPSRYDGWNLIANEAINAGVGVVISDQATSDELIRASGAGIVFQAGNEMKLAEAITSVLENPHVITEFKKNARSYASKISSEIVGQYFIDIVDYTFYKKSNERPKCPWT